MTLTFCAECGSALSTTLEMEAFEGKVIVFAGCIDEPSLEEVVPGAEVWTRYRVRWRGEVKREGVKQCGGCLE